MPASVGGFDLGVDLPTFSSSGVGFWITLFAVIVLVIVFVGVLVWMLIQRKHYFIKIRDFENVSGQGFQLVGRNAARLIKIGDSGEELLLLKKGKTFRTAYGRKMGKNEYWFAKGQDGYWYNVVLGDLDAKMGMLDIEPIDRDMRYMHVAIRKNIQDRYRKEDKISKYIPIAISFMFFIIMIVAMWLLISKVGDLIQVAQANIQASKPVADSLTNAISKLDNLCGAGLR